MTRKRKIELDEDSSGEDASYEPKRARHADDDWKPQRKGRKAAVKGKGKRRDTEKLGELEGSIQSSPHPVSLHVIANSAPLRKALLDWYEGVHASRGMPWRKPYVHSWDAEQKAQRAYEVWVSEIMLQQTQVATVIPYYNKWMEKFPTLRDLASSDIDTVNGLWKGLGYYSRAARLLSGAQKAVAEFGGLLPDNVQDMENKIPGIGRYSAGAICSIAYNHCVPVLDGNVHRLLSRLLALHAPPKAKHTLDVLWAGASTFVKDADRPGDVNQALIELVCKVREPSCGACPLQRGCAGYQRQQQQHETDRQGAESPAHKGAKHATPTTSSPGQAVSDIEELCTLCEPLPVGSPVTAYPMKAEKKKAREELDVVNVIEWRRSPADARWFLLVRRPEGGLLAGLHEFPTAPNVPATTRASAQNTIAHTLLSVLLVSPPLTRCSRSATPSDDQAQITTHRRPSGSTKSSTARSGSESSDASAMRVVKIVPAGEVLHVFSHIRKTYRVQWVVLEGGSSDEPPPLVRSPELGDDGVGTAEAKPKTFKGTASRKNGPTPGAKTKGQSPSTPTQTTQWVHLDAVADANIGTGVMKIWRQVRTLWENVSAAEDVGENEGGCDD